jgi:subtilase family serine protease
MHQLFRPVAIASLTLALTACSQGTQSALQQIPQTQSPTASNPMYTGRGELPSNVRRVCDGPTPIGYARCIALVRTDIFMPDAVSPNVAGYGPADLQAAYGLPSTTAGAGQTVAIVDAYNDSHAESDLKAYRSHFHLTPCTTYNRCFRRLNQAGRPGPYPPGDANWAAEMSLDLDMVSAVCPKCRILLIEANSNAFLDLALSVDTAARLGAREISNSYGGGEFLLEVSYQSHYNHPGVMITASSGDSGYGPQFPAASQYVTAVGGTTLTRASGSRGWAETVWSGAGSGCSLFVSKPAWQHDPSCGTRTIADVSAVADPATGVAVYDKGWFVYGGTSVSSPIIAAVYALAANGATSTYAQDSYLHSGSMFDITAGSNGSCGGSYLCTGMVGYDGPSGNGTPNGTGGF